MTYVSDAGGAGQNTATSTIGRFTGVAVASDTDDYPTMWFLTSASGTNTMLSPKYK